VPPPTANFRGALEVLARHQVELIVVGGVAAVLNGAPISTFDLDIVHARTPDNLSRLVLALDDLDARYRDPAGRILRPDEHGLGGAGHHLLMTRCGPLDVLGQIGGAEGYERLLAESAIHTVGELSIRVLSLTALIRVKEKADRPKDRAVLAILRATLEESTARG
jgi:hypothetical protein